MAIPADRDVDVLVVGLGPGGGAAAHRAAEAGLRVLAVDKKKLVGEPVQCAEFIPTPLGAYAQDEGVLLQRITGMKSYLPSGAVEISDFPGLMVDRAAFDRALSEKAVAAGAEVLTQTRLVALEADDIAVLGRGSKTERVRYRLLIGADGPHSTVADLTGLPHLPVVYTRQYTVALKRPYVDTDIWLSDDFPGGYGWLFPKGARANLGLGADKRFEDNLKAPLERLHAQLIEAGLVGEEIYYRTGGAIPVGGMRPSLVYRNRLLVGDAAGLTHPITGAGISAAVASGERAGRAAIECIRDGKANALPEFDEDVRDQFETTLARAVERRRFLEQCWRQPAAAEDRVMRRGWIAFEEYFAA
jgi:digeranylgeranylglycerophospholipid reductase